MDTLHKRYFEASSGVLTMASIPTPTSHNNILDARQLVHFYSWLQHSMVMLQHSMVSTIYKFLIGVRPLWLVSGKKHHRNEWTCFVTMAFLLQLHCLLYDHCIHLMSTTKKSNHKIGSVTQVPQFMTNMICHGNSGLH